MDAQEILAEQFEANRPHLTAVAYRMLGSLSEAEDAVQEGWLRLSRTDSSQVANLRGWLTTVVGRVCLDVLRSRAARREDPLDERLPDAIVSRASEVSPEDEAVLVDSVGLALLVVLETLGPAERLAFVLHDMFAMPYEQIAPIIGRSPAAAKQLASRARHRVRGSVTVPEPDVRRQRQVVDAFLAAARGGDFDALVAVLDPDVVLRSDRGATAGGLTQIRGAAVVADQALTFSRFAYESKPVLVNGVAGMLSLADGRPVAVMGFTIANDKIVAIDILADPERLASLDVTVL